MTETEYRKLLIDSVRAGEYLEKDALLDLLKISSLRFEKNKCVYEASMGSLPRVYSRMYRSG